MEQGHLQQRTGQWTLRALTAAALIALPVMSLGCGSDSKSTSSDSSSSSATDSSGTSDSSATDSSGTSDSSATDSSGAATTKVNANTASVAELTTAFDAAGVPNASKWAREVEEYRPYSDDNWQHLREELAKYNIDEATFTLITSVLTLG